jgi:ABC-type multidrug transport system ATPase subunit
MGDLSVSVSDLFKSYKGLHAVDGLSFDVGTGRIYGFLGQNGAGKSTTIRMLTSLIRPTAGHIHIFGYSLAEKRGEILKRIGAVIEKPDLYKYLTAFENLEMMARLSGSKKSSTALLKQLDMVGLRERATSKVKTFSQGMKQRLGIACALIHDPELIILDEPLNGLDPQGIADMRNLILHLGRNEKKTIIVSSHLLGEMELIADDMLIIDKGKKVAEGTVHELLNPAQTVVDVQTQDNTFARQQLQTSQWMQYLVGDASSLTFRMHRDEIPALVRSLVEWGIDIIAVTHKHSLEDYFLSLTSSNQHVATYQD